MEKLPFQKQNYRMMAIGLLVIAVGFAIMALAKEKFGFVAISLGPVVVIAGFVTEIFAILRTPQRKQ